ncbi:MAG: hypothetical protein C4332_12395 [Meiothermus sp.]
MKSINRRELIRRLQLLGFEGPFSGGKHQYMRRNSDGKRITLPNPHKTDVSGNLLAKILRDANLTREEWERSAE